MNSQCRVPGATHVVTTLLTAAFGWWGSSRALSSPSSYHIPFSFSESRARGQGLGCFEGKDLGQVTHIIWCEMVRNKQHWPQFVTGVSLLSIVCPQLSFPCLPSPLPAGTLLPTAPTSCQASFRPSSSPLLQSPPVQPPSVDSSSWAPGFCSSP